MVLCGVQFDYKAAVQITSYEMREVSREETGIRFGKSTGMG